ncbi:hypothetical protein NL676_009794 [Syzygium grande]|nr:hypothetical protein NL676_009794 [Syzygium grande]
MVREAAISLPGNVRMNKEQNRHLLEGSNWIGSSRSWLFPHGPAGGHLSSLPLQPLHLLYHRLRPSLLVSPTPPPPPHAAEWSSILCHSPVDSLPTDSPCKVVAIHKGQIPVYRALETGGGGRLGLRFNPRCES